MSSYDRFWQRESFCSIRLCYLSVLYTRTTLDVYSTLALLYTVGLLLSNV